MNGRSIMFVATLTLVASCSKKGGGYSGTVVIGQDYVQILATAPSDQSCPPRVQRAGSCVRTPPADDPSCGERAACITGVTVEASGQPAIRSSSAHAAVPWLAKAGNAVTITIDGCAGAQRFTVDPGPSMAPFAKASVRLAAGRVNATWTPAAGANQVCALWRWPRGVEVCCAGEGGAASFDATDIDGITDARLSRGRRLADEGRLRIYRTRETENVLTR